MMNYKNINGKQNRRETQDERIGRMRSLFSRRRVRTRNPVHPVHPVKKIPSGESIASSGLDGVSAHRGAGLAPMRGSVRNLLISRIGLLQVIDFHDFSGFFSWFLSGPFNFFKVQNRLMQVVDFHDSFRYFSHVFDRNLSGNAPPECALGPPPPLNGVAITRRHRIAWSTGMNRRKRCFL